MGQKKDGKKRKLTKGRIKAIVVAAAACAFVIALIITNLFIPVKYIASYFVIRNGGARDGVMRVRFVDVGYGDCVIVELPDGKNMLIDAGNGAYKNEARILKFLNKCDIDTIDYLVCTSVNNEHCGGLAEIVKNKKIKKAYMPYCKNAYITDGYRDFVLAVNSVKAQTAISEYGAGEVNGEYGYFFTFLSPTVHTDLSPTAEYVKLNEDPTDVSARNNSSAVIWLEYGDTGILLLGDGEASLQTKIVSAYSVSGDLPFCPIGGYSVNLEKCRVLKVANHGNKSSACAELFSILHPEAAVISVGRNGSGCPSVEVLSDAINYVGSRLYRTDEYGTVTVEVTKQSYAVK